LLELPVSNLCVRLDRAPNSNHIKIRFTTYNKNLVLTKPPFSSDHVKLQLALHCHHLTTKLLNKVRGHLKLKPLSSGPVKPLPQQEMPESIEQLRRDQAQLREDEQRLRNVREIIRDNPRVPVVTEMLEIKQLSWKDLLQRKQGFCYHELGSSRRIVRAWSFKMTGTNEVVRWRMTL
jgi:hypothetical protein